MRARHDRRGGVGARRGDQLVAVEDAHAGRLGLEQPARLVDDQGEHLLRVVDRRQVSRNLVQRLQALAIAVRLAEEPGVPHEEAHLLGDPLQQRELSGRESPPLLPPYGVERAHHIALEHERQQQTRLMREGAEEIVGETRVARDLVGVHRTALLPQRGLEALALQGERRRRERGQILLRDMVGGGGPEPAGLQQVGRSRVGAGQPRELATDPPQRLPEVERGVDLSGDPEQRLRLGEAVRGLALQAAVVALKPPPLEDTGRDAVEARQIHRLGDVADHALLHGRDGRVERRLRRHDDELRRRGERARLGEQRTGLRGGGHEVEQDQPHAAVPDSREGLGARPGDDDPVSLAIKPRAHLGERLAVVGDEQDRLGLAHSHSLSQEAPSAEVLRPRLVLTRRARRCAPARRGARRAGR